MGKFLVRQRFSIKAFLLGGVAIPCLTAYFTDSAYANPSNFVDYSLSATSGSADTTQGNPIEGTPQPAAPSSQAPTSGFFSRLARALTLDSSPDGTTAVSPAVSPEIPQEISSDPLAPHPLRVTIPDVHALSKPGHFHPPIPLVGNGVNPAAGTPSSSETPPTAPRTNKPIPATLPLSPPPVETPVSARIASGMDSSSIDADIPLPPDTPASQPPAALPPPAAIPTPTATHSAINPVVPLSRVVGNTAWPTANTQGSTSTVSGMPDGETNGLAKIVSAVGLGGDQPPPPNADNVVDNVPVEALPAEKPLISTSEPVVENNEPKPLPPLPAPLPEAASNNPMPAPAAMDEPVSPPPNLLPAPVTEAAPLPWSGNTSPAPVPQAMDEPASPAPSSLPATATETAPLPWSDNTSSAPAATSLPPAPDQTASTAPLPPNVPAYAIKRWTGPDAVRVEDLPPSISKKPVQSQPAPAAEIANPITPPDIKPALPQLPPVAETAPSVTPTDVNPIAPEPAPAAEIMPTAAQPEAIPAPLIARPEVASAPDTNPLPPPPPAPVENPLPAYNKPATEPEKPIIQPEPAIKPLPEPVYIEKPAPVAEPAPPRKELSADTKKILSKIPSHPMPDMDDFASPIAIDHAKTVPQLDKSPIPNDDVKSHESVGIKVEVKAPKMNLDYELEKAYEASIAGRSDAAIITYKNVLEVDPNNKNALFGLATTYHRAGQLDLARPLYARLLSVDPNHRDGLNNFLVLLADEAPEEALSQLQKLQMSNPGFSPIPAQIAIIDEKLGHLDQAAESMQHAIELAPENLTYRYNLAVMLDRQHRYKEAADLYRQIIQAYQRGERTPGNIEKIQQRLTFISSNRP